MPDNFIPIEISSLVTNTMTGFDLYIERKSGSKVLYRGGETIIDADVLSRLHENRNDILYVSENDWSKYQEYLGNNLEHIAADESVPVERRCQIVYTTSTHIMEQVFEHPRTAEAVKQAQKLIAPTVSMILSGEEAMRNMIQLTSHDYYTYTHSVNVCVFGVSLTTKLFPDLSIEQMERIGGGLLLHDIGKRKIPAEIIRKNGPLTGDEWKIMRQHPEFGIEALAEGGVTHEEAQVITVQHHERFDGGGYPYRLKGDEIHVWAKICCIADCFDALTTTRSYREPSTSFEALRIMKEEMIYNFDREFFQRYVELFAAA